MRYLLFIMVALLGCDSKPEPISYGKDACHFCKMNIMEPEYAAELVTAKGKVYKFDDVACMVKYLKSGEFSESDFKFILVNDFNSKELIDVHLATFVRSENYKSPMRGDAAAFEKSLAPAKSDSNELVSWDELFNIF